MRQRFFISAIIILALALISFSALASATTRTDTYSTAGSYTWTAPPGLTTTLVTQPQGIIIEVWGAGGGAGGGAYYNDQGGGGGGGGAYSKKTITGITQGTAYTVVVGTHGSGGEDGTAGGDSYFNTSTSVMAKGGSYGISPNTPNYGKGGAGGDQASGYGDTKYSGGKGGDSNSGCPVASNTGGGGGSSGGTAATGNDGGIGYCGSAGAGGSAPTGGGGGANGGYYHDGYAATQVGGGGGGGGAYDGSHRIGGDGYDGQVKITYTMGVTCTGYGCFFIRDSSGNTRAVFDDQGFFDLDGNFTQNDASGTISGDFVLMNSSGTVLAWIDNTTGNMKIAGTLSHWNNTTCTPPAKSFIILNKTGSCVAYIGTAGQLWLRYGGTANSW